ncbi:MAG: lytic murein transglycosylase, partial [Variovorax sp.]
MRPVPFSFQPARSVAALAGAIVVLAGCASPPVAVAPTRAAQSATPVDDEAQQQRAFAQWIAAFRRTARAAGVSEATLQSALDTARYLPRVVELDQAQPEFTRTVWAYLDNTVTPQRVSQGQEKLQQLRTELDAASARYGVPPAIVVAIWGMESNYGGNYGNTPTIDALATLGFEGRREAFAQR